MGGPRAAFGDFSRLRINVRQKLRQNDLSLIMALIATLASPAHLPGYPPGFNGLAETPPLGWRSWNAYGGGVTQRKIQTRFIQDLLDGFRY